MEKKFDNDEMEIDLKELFAVVMDKILWILLAGVACAVAVFLVTKLAITPKYTSSTQIYVLSQQNADQVSYNDLQMSSQLADDCAALVKSRTVTSQVIEKLGLNMTDDQLAGQISIKEASSSGRVMDIVVTHENPAMAQKIADSVREIAADYFVDTMALQAVNTVETANLPKSPSSPSVMKNTAIGFIGGFVLAAAVVIILFITNDKIRTQDDVEKYLGLSVLGVIPDTDEGMNTEEQVAARKKKSSGKHAKMPAASSAKNSKSAKSY